MWITRENFPVVSISLFEVIFKANQEDITRFVFPIGLKVSDDVDKVLYSLRYVRVDGTVSKLSMMGLDTQMGKGDTESTTVHPNDHHLNI